MRSAPPVLVPVGRFLWGARIHWALALSSALVLGTVSFAALAVGGPPGGAAAELGGNCT